MLLSAAAPHTAPDPHSVYRLVKQRNKQNLALEVKISLPPSPSLSVHLHPALSFMERNYPASGFGDLGTGTGWSYERSAKAR